MLGLDKLEIYRISMTISEKVWLFVIKWQYFEKNTVGNQIVRSADSIPANISEGYGRFHYRDSQKFLFYARGSLYETMTWLKLARMRNLISEEDYSDLEKQCIRLSVKLNNFIKAVGKNNGT